MGGEQPEGASWGRAVCSSCRTTAVGKESRADTNSTRRISRRRRGRGSVLRAATMVLSLAAAARGGAWSLPPLLLSWVAVVLPAAVGVQAFMPTPPHAQHHQLYQHPLRRRASGVVVGPGAAGVVLMEAAASSSSSSSPSFGGRNETALYGAASASLETKSATKKTTTSGGVGAAGRKAGTPLSSAPPPPSSASGKQQQQQQQEGRHHPDVGGGKDGEWSGGPSGLEGPLDGSADDEEDGGALKASLLMQSMMSGGAVDKAAGGAAKPEEGGGGDEEPVAAPAAPRAAPKRKGRGRRTAAQEELDFTVKTVDDVCRATVSVISSGDEEDLRMLTPLVERLLTRYGDRIEILHRSFVPDDRTGIRLLEIWFEGFETFPLFSRYKFLKKGKKAELTEEAMEEMCHKIDFAIYLDATGDYGPL